MSFSFLRRLSGVAALLLAVAGAALVAEPALARSTNTLGLESLAFQTNQVDATTAWTVVPLTWTVSNTASQANDLYGTVTLRMEGDSPGSYVGQTYQLDYRFEDTYYLRARYVSGTLQQSTYTYDFVVPQYAATSQARWTVTRVTVQDGEGGALTVEGADLLQHQGTLTATTLIDATPPAVAMFNLQRPENERPYAYVKDASSYVGYDAWINDVESGFWKGTVTLSGPQGQTASGDFDAKWFEGDNPRCGRTSGGDIRQVSCGITLFLPANAAAGAWRVSEVALIDNVGNRGVIVDPPSPQITVTSNEVVSASNFVVDPNPVNNWTQDVTTSLKMNVSGAQGSVTAVLVDFESPRCRQVTTTPTVEGDGRVSVPVLLYRGLDGCVVDGLVIVDGVGNAAIYGARFEAPDPGLAVTRLPNTTPPTAANIALNHSTIRKSQIGSLGLQVTMDVAAPIAPVTSYELYRYDGNGNQFSSVSGGTSPNANGVLTLYPYLPYDIEPGTYTFGFRIIDASRLSSYYGMPGMPGNHELPPGVLQLTVTAD